MRRATLLLPLLLPLVGCPCPSIEGASELLTLHNCELRLDRPIQVGSPFALNLDASEPNPAATWTSSAPTVLSVTTDGVDADARAEDVGAAELTVAVTDGDTDTFDFDVVRADAATIVDPFTEIVADQIASEDNALVGELPIPPVGPVLRLVRGATVALEVRLESGGDGVSWAPEAVTTGGPVGASAGGEAFWFAGAGAGTVADDAGTELASVEVVEVEADAGAAIALGVYPVDRTDEVDPENAPILGAYLRAVVTDADGGMIHQPVLTWSLAGPGAVTAFADDPDWGGIGVRTDLASWELGDGEVDRFASAEVCVVATIETADGPVSKSALLTPDGVTIAADGDCAGRAGCLCAAAAPLHPGVALLPLLFLVPRRRPRTR